MSIYRLKIWQNFFRPLLPRAVLFTFFVTSILGIFTCLNMAMNLEMNMAMHPIQAVDCAMTNDSAVCPMSTAEHIVRWQNTFLFIENSSSPLLTWFTLICAWSVVAIIHRAFLIASPPFEKISYYTSYLREHQGYRLYNYFLHIFSRGILQPKLFA